MIVGEYLERIGCPEHRGNSVQDLFGLHEAHLGQVPFENLSIHRGEPIHLEPDALFDKIVHRRRGGFCYELNGLFAELLLALGFEVDRLAARVYGSGGRLGIPFDHLCLRVRAEGQLFLADVGFGDCFVTPLRWNERGDQRGYRISPAGEDYDLLKGDQPQYRFGTTPYALADFAGGCRHHQTSPESTFTQKRVCSRLTERGRITLRDDRLIETTDGEVRETPIDAAGWERLLRERFGMS